MSMIYRYRLLMTKFNPSSGDVAFTWNSPLDDMQLFNMTELAGNVMNWKTNKVKMLVENNRQFDIDGRTWYSLIVQSKKSSMCHLSFDLCSVLVDGVTFLFTTEHTRDFVFQMHNSKKLTESQLRRAFDNYAPPVPTATVPNPPVATAATVPNPPVATSNASDENDGFYAALKAVKQSREEAEAFADTFANAIRRPKAEVTKAAQIKPEQLQEEKRKKAKKKNKKGRGKVIDAARGLPNAEDNA